MRLSQVTRCCDHNTPVRVEKKKLKLETNGSSDSSECISVQSVSKFFLLVFIRFIDRA